MNLWKVSSQFARVHILQKTPGHLLAILPCWDTLHTSDRLAPSLLLTPRTGWCVGNTVSHLYFNYIAVDIQRLFLSHTCLWRGKFVWLRHLCPDRIILFTAAKWMDSTQHPPLTITHPPSTETASWVGCLRNWIRNIPVMFTSRVTWLITLFVPTANRGTTAGSSGDEIGKALASVSSFDFLC